MNIGQTEVSALEPVRQTSVVNAQQVQDRGLQVVNVDAVFRHAVAKVVARTVCVIPGLIPPPAIHIVKTRP